MKKRSSKRVIKNKSLLKSKSGRKCIKSFKKCRTSATRSIVKGFRGKKCVKKFRSCVSNK